jgi:DNA-binding CsgD family transcriptional regulator
MNRTDLFKTSGDAIAAIGTDAFPAALSALLRAVSPYNYTVIFGYNGKSQPIDLFDDFPKGKRKVFVSDYQEGPYLLDPFFLAATQPVAPGLYRMRDLAPDRFYQGEYFRSYYIQTGLAEEIGFFIALPDQAMVVVSMMRDTRAFSNRDFKALEEVRPVVEACAHRHWHDLSSRFGATAQNADGSPLQSQIDRSFHAFGGGLLTAREREIVEFTLKGHSADAIGRILGISPGTVRIHRRNIYSKMRISSQGELFSRFIRELGASS